MPRIPLSQIVMGMNSRNSRLVKAVNPFTAIQLVDSKIKFKKTMARHNIATPDIYDTIRTVKDIPEIPWQDLMGKNVVIKPDKGYGGNGILVLRWSKKAKTWMSGGVPFEQKEIIRHLRNILDGQFSKGNIPDKAFIEEMIVGHKFFRDISTSGLADIRVVVYNGVPLMAMLRLPTITSGGRANLHSGGLGVGVDIGTGRTTTVIHNNQVIGVHPDTALPLDDLRVPKWRKVLELAVEAQKVSGLGYAGVDIVIDKNRRVMVLEANARPGLAIQIANLAGLNERVTRIRNLRIKSYEHGMRLATELFSEEEHKRWLGRRRPVLARIVEVTLHNPETGEVKNCKAKVDTGADSSSIDIEIARAVGYGPLLDELKQFLPDKTLTIPQARALMSKLDSRKHFKELRQHGIRLFNINSATGSTLRWNVPLILEIKDRRFETSVTITDRSYLNYPMIIGAADLGGFFIDVNA